MAGSEISRWAGLVWGASMAPVVGLTSWARRSRTFHPRGVTCRAHVLVAARGGPERALAERLAGHALVRFSGALWKDREWPDVLGCALRFRSHAGVSSDPEPEDQDLLLATVRNPLTTLVAALGTNYRDYLRNDYFGVSPFEAPFVGRVKFRLRPELRESNGRNRAERLHDALSGTPLALWLELRDDRVGAQYRPCVRVELVERAILNDEALRFDPFRTGRGVCPTGLVHYARVVPYAASQLARARIGANEAAHGGRLSA